MEKKKRRRIKKPEPDSSDEDGEMFTSTIVSHVENFHDQFQLKTGLIMHESVVIVDCREFFISSYVFLGEIIEN